MSDFNAFFFEKLYSKLAASLVDDAGGQLFAIGNPGQFIPYGLNPAAEMDGAAILSAMFDPVQQFSWVLKQQQGRTISGIYNSVLNNKETPVMPVLNAGQLIKLKDAEDLYWQRIELYSNYKYNYEKARQEYLIAKAIQINGGQPVRVNIQKGLNDAMDKWIMAGHKNMMENALAVITEFGPLALPRFWDLAMNKFRDRQENSQRGTVFQKTDFQPNYNQWFQDAGWSRFYFNRTDRNNQRNDELLGVAGMLDYSFGLFPYSRSSDYNSDREYLKIDETDIDIQCELMRVNIERGWLDPLVLSNRAWRFNSNSPDAKTILSSGADIKQRTAPFGEMTVLPVAVILCRSVRIIGRFENNLTQQITRIIDDNGAVGFGPFAISGKRYGQEDRVRGVVMDNRIDVNDIQVLGLICQIMKKSPNPDPSLPWKK